ncbi:MAG: hypothetical protein ACP5G0_01965 [Desulfomonilia bacterium]
MESSHVHFSEHLTKLAESIQTPSRDISGSEVMQSLVTVLTTIMDHAMDGTDHIPHPDHSSPEKSAVCACFMAACTVPMISSLKEEGIDIQGDVLMDSAGSVLFSSYSEQQRSRILRDGMYLLSEIIEDARGNTPLEQWLTTVHSTTMQYILTEGENEYIELFAPLYLVLLMAAKQASSP